MSRKRARFVFTLITASVFLCIVAFASEGSPPMLFRTLSAAVYGINADLVDIEVDLTPVRGEADSPLSVTIVGLPDAAVRESRERIRAAVSNCGFFFPFQRITINLAPADVRKEGASFDLPIALGILGANGDLAEQSSLTH